ncbi:MAG: 4Fe-4S binding protein [Thermoanaerobaculia bacterium]|nr:4Fe-4S binding protein [Thermoanaerobaculia bacterium]
MVIHPAECTDCTLCVDACPVEAIFPEAEVPSRWRAWIDRGYRAFGLEVPGRG